MSTQLEHDVHCTIIGNADIADLAFVRSLLDVHTRFKMYVEVVFGRDLQFVLALKDGTLLIGI